MLSKFTHFISDQQWLQDQDKVLLAVSGGVDSMVMVDLFGKANIPFAIAHVNFQLRGSASDGDEQLVKEVAAKWKVAFHVHHADTKGYAQKQRISTQQAARDIRYKWFGELCRAHQYAKLATAHHASDQTETILYNLTKGTGIAGLRGIPQTNDYIIRPLLFADRGEIEAYARAQALVWREDASNSDETYHRNLIRHTVVPKLRIINPGIDKTMYRNAMRNRSLEELLETSVKDIKAKYLKKGSTGEVLDLKWLDHQPGALVVLEAILSPYGFTNDQVVSIYTGGQVGSVFYAADKKAYLDRQVLYLEAADDNEDGFEVTIEKGDTAIRVRGEEYRISVVDGKGFKVVRNPWVGCFDYDKLHFPLKMRNWQQGDSFVPLGMKSKKKLSDFMIDQKIPLNLKSRVPLLQSKKDIVWVVGYRIDNRYKVTDTTTKVLLIEKTHV